MKLHGLYKQIDRDTRAHHTYMVRVKLPGGVLAPDQYLALDAMADSLRATARQGIQFHGVIEGDVKPRIRAINDALLTTLGACGDVARNVMAPPEAVEIARAISRDLMPQTRAYHEIYLDGEPVVEDREPFYGPNYLPRKFKVGIATLRDNSADVYSQDVGLIVLPDGVDVLIGGGLGFTHRKAATYARMASPFGNVRGEDVVETARTIASIFRDYGDRSNRRHARLKYLVEEWGVGWFRDQFHERTNVALRPWVDTGPLGYDDRLGVGDRTYGVHVESGRIAGEQKRRLRRVVEVFRPGVAITPGQNVLLFDLDDPHAVERILRPRPLSGVRRYAMACPALPTCGQALAEAERILGRVVDELEALGLEDEPIAVRITGCPNGCARPYTADLAFVGTSPDRYNIYAGGSLGGDRLAALYATDVPTVELAAAVRPLFERWAREGGSSFGDFFNRLVGGGRRTVLTGSRDIPLEVRP